jgi:hypothetical protein
MVVNPDQYEKHETYGPKEGPENPGIYHSEDLMNFGIEYDINPTDIYRNIKLHI